MKNFFATIFISFLLFSCSNNQDNTKIENQSSEQKTEHKQEEVAIKSTQDEENSSEWTKEEKRNEIEKNFIKNNSPLSLECRKALRKKYDNVSVFDFWDDTARLYSGYYTDLTTQKTTEWLYWGIVTWYHTGKQYYCELTTMDGENFNVIEAKFK